MTATKPDALITVQTAAQQLNAADVMFIDARFKLDDPAWGGQAFADAHIPGAVFLDLDADLSSPVVPGVTGRHPLPDVDVFEARMREIGLKKSDLVIVYDEGTGFHAARVWWLLTWLGHDRVSVLDGGLAAWRAAALPETAQQTVRTWPGDFTAQPDATLLIDADEIMSYIRHPTGNSELCLLDARAPERFRGEAEPIDPVAGHIPGAVCMPCGGNLDSNGQFKPADELRARFPEASPPQGLACYCGSGVTACHNILAAVVAGLPMPRLYAGSWSEWITDPQRPVATGA